MVGTGGVDTVLVGNDFPELGTDLVAALTTLDMNNFTHVEFNSGEKVGVGGGGSRVSGEQTVSRVEQEESNCQQATASKQR